MTSYIISSFQQKNYKTYYKANKNRVWEGPNSDGTQILEWSDMEVQINMINMWNTNEKADNMQGMLPTYVM